MLGSTKYFNFLRLPREIRDKIYEYALCSFSGYNLLSFEQCGAVYAKVGHERRQFTGDLDLLLANRQIHSEGYKCMFARNQFVIIEVESSLRSWLYGHLPVYILSSRLVDEPERGCLESYPWYIMRLKVKVKGNKPVMSLSQENPSPQSLCSGVVMLWEDCVDMLKRYGDYPTQHLRSHPKLKPAPYNNLMKVVVDLNPTKKWWSGKDSYTDLWASHFAIDRKRLLLGQIKDALCGCDDFEIIGCDDETFAAEVIREVARIPYISLASFQSQLHGYAYKAENSWRLGNNAECANFCTRGIEIIYCVQSNRFLTRQLYEDGVDDCLDMARSSHTLHVLLARCLHTHLSTLFENDIEHDCRKSIATITQGRWLHTPLSMVFEGYIELDCHRYIAMISHSIKHLFEYYHDSPLNYLPRHHPSPHEEAEEYYMRAKSLRLRSEYSIFPVTEDLESYVEKATRLCPGNRIYQEEERKAKAWISDYEKYHDTRHYRSPEMAQWRKEFLPTAFEY